MVRPLCLFALILTMTVGSLGAEEWRVAIVPLSRRSEQLASLVSERAELFGTHLVGAEGRQRQWAERAEDTARQAYELERARLFKSADSKALKTMGEFVFEAPTLPTAISYTTVGYNRALAQVLESTDAAQRWYRGREGLDGIITVEIVELGSFDRLIVTAIEDTPSLLIDHLVQHGSFHQIGEELDRALLSYSTQGEWGALVIEGAPPSVEIHLDGALQQSRTRIFVLPAGQVELSLTSPSYEPLVRSLTVKRGAITNVDATMAASDQKPVAIQSTIGAVHWFVDGIDRGTSLSLSVAKPTYPFTVLATKEGFADRLIALPRGGVPELSITMEGAVSRDKALLLREQEDFYKALRKTILLFGAYVATLAIGESVGFESTVWPPVQVASGAFAMVNLLGFVAQLATYGR